MFISENTLPSLSKARPSGRMLLEVTIQGLCNLRGVSPVGSISGWQSLQYMKQECGEILGRECFHLKKKMKRHIKLHYWAPGWPS